MYSCITIKGTHTCMTDLKNLCIIMIVRCILILDLLCLGKPPTILAMILFQRLVGKINFQKPNIFIAWNLDILIMCVTIENFISTFYLWTTFRVTNLDQIRFEFKRLFDDFYLLFCANYWYIYKINLFSLLINLGTLKYSKRIWPFAWFKWFLWLFSFKNHLSHFL